MRPLLSILIFLTLFGVARCQLRVTVAPLLSYTIPNSSEWSYISDIGGGLTLSIHRPIRWYASTASDSLTLLRKFDMGLQFGASFSPHAIAGQRFSLAPFINQPLFEKGRHSLMLVMQFGLSAYTRPFRLTADTANVFIGSYVNCHIETGAIYRFTLADSSALSFSTTLAHSSNGYLLRPNKGLNYLHFSIGYTLPPQFTGHRSPVTGHRSQVTGHRSRYFDLFASYAPGIVMPRFTGAAQKYYYAHTARLGTLYRFSPKRAAGFDLELTYNYSHDELIAYHHDPYPLPFYGAIAGAYEATYHRLSLHLALAAYVLHGAVAYTPVYERVGLFYNIGNQGKRLRQFVGVSLKSHMAHIDFIEWHYGIFFRVNRDP